jgi:hypothetical protein|tara:strand:+ start:189 stop:707 length:519 start_codon:yes stop_codon:yes gene_type:complete
MKVISTVFLLLITSLASAKNCYESSIVSPTPFMGNNGEVFKLTDGSVWEVKHEYEYLYEYYPSVIICPSTGKLVVDGKTLNVKQLISSKSTPNSPSRPTSAKVIESNIDGDFEGWEGETIVKLMNGQIWEQSEYYYTYHYSYMPKVLIYRSGGGYKMKVDGIEKSVGVIQIK